MRTQARLCGMAGIGSAALLSALPALSGCNVVAGLLLTSGASDGSATLTSAELLGGTRELKVALRPGVSLFQAAQRAPRAMLALRGAARQLGDLSVLDGEHLSAVSAGLLDEGLLLPGPLGALEVSLEVRPEPPVPTPQPVTVDAAGCSESATPAALVGAYRSGARLLILRADGQFVLSSGRHKVSTGSYALRCQVLQLAGESVPAVRLAPLGTDGWRDGGGATFLPLTEQHHGDVR